MTSVIKKTARDVSLDEFTGDLKSAKSMKAYESTLKSLADFVEDKVWTLGLFMEGVSDENIAKFMAVLLVDKGRSPSNRKTAMAAINYQLQINEVENVYDHTHLYPKTHKILDSWTAKLKDDPWFVKKTGHFDDVGIMAIMDLDPKSLKDIQDILFAVVTIFTTMRADDVCYINCDCIQKIAKKASVSRHYSLYAEQTKTDPMGNGPVANRTWLVVCQCEANAGISDKKLFLKAEKSNSFCECVAKCPFQLMTNYLALIPDPTGANAKIFNDAAKISGSPLRDRPRLFRAISTGVDKHFLMKPLG